MLKFAPSESSAQRAAAPGPAHLKTYKISLGLQLAFTVFMGVHVWFNLGFYGPLNYLWFCDIALIVCLIGLWTQSSAMIGMAALASVGPSLLWSADLFWKLASGHWLVGMAGYMACKAVPLPVRLVASFHIWLPVMLVFCLMKLGYDRRALLYQTVLAVTLLIVCRIITNPPPSHGPKDNVNINFVFGNSDTIATDLPAWIYLPKMILGYWFLMYLPTHVALVLLSNYWSNRRSKQIVYNSTHHERFVSSTSSNVPSI